MGTQDGYDWPNGVSDERWPPTPTCFRGVALVGVQDMLTAALSASEVEALRRIQTEILEVADLMLPPAAETMASVRRLHAINKAAVREYDAAAHAAAYPGY